MGDTWYLQLKCATCGADNPSREDYKDDPMENGIYFAPSSGFMHFKCHKCGALNWIEESYRARAINEKDLAELYKENGFE